MSVRLRSKFLIASCALSALFGCSGGDESASDPNAGDTPSVFVAFAANFAGFHDWQAFDVTKDAAPGMVHPDAQLIEYLNKPPPSGSEEFPVGTIIVKEGTDGDPLTRAFFAMVKRGGGYNSDGAPGWEWFELRNAPDGGPGVQIVWRGVGPPLGEVYGGDPNAGCNTCHHDCGNDAVCAPSVLLSQF
jgi:hypothetical protein